MTATTITDVRQGDSISLTGVVQLPTGNWTGKASFLDQRPGVTQRSIFLTVSLSLIGVNATDSSLNDWGLTVSATPQETSQLAYCARILLGTVDPDVAGPDQLATSEQVGLVHEATHISRRCLKCPRSPSHRLSLSTSPSKSTHRLWWSRWHQRQHCHRSL